MYFRFCGLAFGNTYGSAALEQVVINFQRIPDATLFEFVVVHNGIEREFEFYEFFSFLKFNEFYEFFLLKKIAKNW